MLFVHHPDHLIAADLERGAGSDGGGRRQTQPRDGRKRPLAHKVAGCEQRDCGFLADLRNDSEPCTALLEVEHGICGIPLGEERLFGLQFDNSAPQPGIGQEGGRIK